MPLFCNDVLIDKKHEHYNWVIGEISKIRSKNHLRIIPHRNIRRPFTTDPEGRAIPDKFPSTAEPTVANYINEATGIEETWRWSKSHPRKEKDKIIYNESSILITEGEMILDTRNDAELAFFLLNIKKIGSKGRFEVEDPEKDAVQKNEEYGQDAVLRFIIFGNVNNPFYNNDKKIRDISASWGIADTDKKSVAVLRNVLYEAVKESEKNFSVTNRGVEDFIAEVNDADPYSEYRSNIQKGLDTSIIIWDEKDSHFYWGNPKTKEKTQPLLGILAPQKIQKDKLLFDYMRVNPDAYEYLKKHADKEPDKVSKYAYLKWPKEFKEYATERGIVDVNKKTRMIMEKELEELELVK